MTCHLYCSVHGSMGRLLHCYSAISLATYCGSTVARFYDNVYHDSKLKRTVENCRLQEHPETVQNLAGSSFRFFVVVV